MKNVQFKLLAATLASVMLAGAAHAQVVGGTSDPAKVKISSSTVNGGPHSAGKVGFNVPNLAPGQFVDFQGLKTIIGTDANGVTTFVNTTGTTTDHSQYGQFDFAKVGSHDIYFGEWKQTASVTAGDHTVYYGGTGASTSVPTTGSATYAVKGISDYQGKGILTGTFTANFASGSSGTLTGNLANSGSTYGVNIGTANIKADGTFIGSGATATGFGGTPLASSGSVNGRFFGSNVNALAGTVKFGPGNTAVRQYDTAFGGTKNP